MAEWVFIGLGNPGKKYEFTRHNCGFLALKTFAHLEGWSFKEDKRFHAHVAKGQMTGNSIALLLPDTYMNESGRAVQAYLAFYKLGPKNIVVISDDIHIKFGTLRLRTRGSAGGHNGLKSIESHLGTQEYARIRIGIGRAKEEEPLVDYVLDKFSHEELKELPQVMNRAVSALRQIVKASDLTEVMSSVNAKVKQKHPYNGLGEEKHES